jgi:MYXO-CTERM domain-containing protein
MRAQLPLLPLPLSLGACVPPRAGEPIGSSARRQPSAVEASWFEKAAVSTRGRGSRSLGRAIVLAIAVLVAIVGVSGCGYAPSPETAPEESAPEESVGESADALVSYDCTMTQDTGYTSGNPFAITLVHVDGDPVEINTANAFLTMAQAAENDGVQLHISSGFRTMAQQQYYYGCFINCNCNSCNQAAKPGYSNHQSGHALDLNTAAGGVLNWLNAHGASYGWKRTVPSEAWHWEWWGGGPAPTPYCTTNKAPVGYIDSADCTSIAGWAQDQDTPDQPLDVHLYFDGNPGDPAARAFAVHADQHRDDLCAAIGSCNHGYSAAPPRSLLDGQPHTVNPFAIDSMGGTNPALSGGPKTFQCAPPTPPVDALHGVKRWIPSTAVFDAWRFDWFRDLAHEPDALVASFPDGPSEPDAPVVVQADDGTPEVWVIDTGVRRHVIDPASLAAWRFDGPGVIAIQPAAQVYQYPEGADFPAVPFVFSSPSDPKVYILDVPLQPPSLGTGGAGAGGAGGSTGDGSGGGDIGSGQGGSGGDGEDEPGQASGCATTPGSTGSGAAGLGLAAIAMAIAGRRRRGAVRGR